MITDNKIVAENSLLEELNEIDDLPTLPIVITQIQKLIVNPRSNMDQIATVISRDQAIAARVIKLVNSAYYGLSQPVSSIKQAIIILGLNSVKNLTLGVSIIKTFESVAQTSIFDREQFWIHSLATALCSKHLAMELHYDEPEDFFLAGLMHDIGILIMDQFFHKKFMEILKISAIKNISVQASEKVILGITHTEIGEFIAKQWNLADHIIKAIRFHHEPATLKRDNIQSTNCCFLVHLSDILVHENNIGTFCQSPIGIIHSGVRKSIKIDEESIIRIVNNIKTDIKTIVKEWGL